MTMTAESRPATLDAERTDLLDELAAARAALVATTDGLTDEQLGERPTVSALCLGGLIKHVTGVEEMWASFVEGGPSAVDHSLPDGVSWQDIFAGTATSWPQWLIDHQGAFHMLPEDTLDGILERYRLAAARTEQVVASVVDLSVTQPLPEAPWYEPGGVRSVRRVIVHLIAETIQHAGHADILRESIDGRTAG